MKNKMYLNVTITFLFACLMASTSFAQWNDQGTYVRTNDNVTIGTSSNNDYALHVRKNDSAWQGRFANRSGAGADVYLAHGAGFGMSVIGRTDDNKYTLRLAGLTGDGVENTNMFYNNGTVALGLRGNVGIGVIDPENKLEVKGTIRAEEVKVELGWGDYVFYDDYQLPTLEEEKAHIEKNGHLLGFESEKAMAGKIQLGDVAKRQQVKIEEIMLHLIELKKENEELKKEMEILKAKVEK